MYMIITSKYLEKDKKMFNNFRKWHEMVFLDSLYVLGGSKKVEKYDGDQWTVVQKGLQGSFARGGSVAV